MYIHKYLKYLNEGDQWTDKGGVMSAISSYFFNSNGKQFFYNVGGMTYTLEEMKHGVLWGNRKAPGAIFRTFSKGDQRAFFQDRNDPRILFLCLDLPDFAEHIECFDSPDTISSKLDDYLREYFLCKVEIDAVNEEITLPKVMETYKSDIGSDEDLLRFVWNWYQNYEYDIE